MDDHDDVLASYYKSKLPDESLGQDDDAHGSGDAAEQQVTQQQATLRADELITLAVECLSTPARTPHLLIRTPDILWLNAGGTTESAFRRTCDRFGEVQRIKVFPRQAFACVSYADAQTAASAQIALDNHTIYCGPLSVGFLQQFLSRDAILACQHMPRHQGPPAPPDAVRPAYNPPGQAHAANTGVPHELGMAAHELDEAVESYLQFLLGD